MCNKRATKIKMSGRRVGVEGEIGNPPNTLHIHIIMVVSDV